MTVRTLVVDDSPLMQALISETLATDPGIEVVGTAGDANEARTMIKELNPDVLTLDVEMPGMDGLDFLERIMRLRPMPVVMLSSLTTAGAEVSLEALQLGAFECVDKATLRANGVQGVPSHLHEIVKAASASRPRQSRSASQPAAPQAPTGDYRPREGSMIAIGASTGGVEALIELLTGFPANCPPTVIVQHMPATFTPSFAARLNRLCQPTVEEARSGSVLEVGKIYLAPGGDNHMEVVGNDARRHCRLVAADKVNGHRPSVDKLFFSVARVAGRQAVAAILTGMGNDGAAGIKAMRDQGSVTIGQDKATSVVYGMPAEAFRVGGVCEQLPLRRIAARILQECHA